MTSGKHGFLSSKNTKNGDSQLEGKEEQIKKIAELRALARAARDANNVLMQKVWKIDRELAKLDQAKASEDEKNPLLEEKAEIEAVLEKEGYEATFLSLLDELRKLEIEVLGKTDLNDSVFEL